MNSGTTGQLVILIVEEGTELRDSLSNRLVAEGYDVQSADGVVAALQSLLSTPPDLVLVDADAPDAAGFEAVSRLKAADDTGFTPIILIGEPTETHSKVLANLAGADEYHIKSANVDVLFDRIHSMLRMRRLYMNLLEENRELQLAYDTQRDSWTLFSSLYTHGPIACLLIAADTLIINQANDEAAALTGYDVHSMVGQSVDHLVPGDEGKQWMSLLCRELTGPATISREGDIVAADGRRIPVEVIGRRVAHQDKTVLALALMDVRQRNEAYQERLSAQRAAMVRETAIGVNSKVNDPLFVILNDLATLQNTLNPDDGPVQSRLSRALEAAQRIQRVTAQLSAIQTPISKEYLPGVRMLDLDESVGASSDRTPAAED